MGKKVNVKKDIKEAKEVLRDLMQESLANIAEDFIDKIMKNYSNASASQKVNSAKNVEMSGINAYRKELLEAMAIISADALEKARLEIPSKSKTKLAEWDEDALRLGQFESLPSKVKKRLNNQANILTESQAADLKKVILFQFSSSVDSTDSEQLIRYDIFESAGDFIKGPTTEAGSGVIGARVINEARQAFFFDDEVLEDIEAFVFMNDVPETPICEDLSNGGQGKVFSADDPGFLRYTPPLHYNCDSYILPVVKGNLDGREIEKLQPSDPALEAYIQFKENHVCTGRVHLADI